MGAPLVGDDVLASDFAWLAAPDVAYTTTPVSPLVSTASTPTTVVTLSSLLYEQDVPYEIEYFMRISLAGLTSDGAASAALFIATTSGTRFFRPLNETVVGSNYTKYHAACRVKRTAGSGLSLTVVMAAEYSSSGSPTSMALQANTDAPAYLRRRRLPGVATDYPDAIEIPTA